MTEPLKQTLALPHLHLQIHPGTELILQLWLRNQMSEAILLRPTLDDWVVDDGQILSLVSRLDPGYAYLFQGSEVICRITIPIPLPLKAGQTLKSWLRFPSILEEAIPIELEISSPSQPPHHSPSVELSLSVTFPLSTARNKAQFGATDKTTAGIFGLISGLINLDQIPSRWLVAELLILLCQNGENYAQTQPGSQLLSHLSRTRFFQNGVQAFTSAQLPDWIAQSFSTANAILDSQMGQQGLLYLWEQWLLGLAQTDLEVEQSQDSFVPPLLMEAFVTQPGRDAQRWFAGILLGLAQISPRIANTLSAIATQDTSRPTLDNNSISQASYSLILGLPGLDALPVRWLVVELLIILCQNGEEYTRTEAGHQLFSQLDRTRFFKNGVLAFASAQAPRWILISQAAASAYQTSLSNSPMAQGGLLYVGEEWLWSLEPGAVKAGEKSSISIADSTRTAFVTELGMDAQRWFAGIVLGLTLVSPRIAAIVKAIASQAPPPTPTVPTVTPPIMLDDVLGESGSMQR